MLGCQNGQERALESQCRHNNGNICYHGDPRGASIRNHSARWQKRASLSASQPLPFHRRPRNASTPFNPSDDCTIATLFKSLPTLGSPALARHMGLCSSKQDAAVAGDGSEPSVPRHAASPLSSGEPAHRYVAHNVEGSRAGAAGVAGAVADSFPHVFRQAPKGGASAPDIGFRCKTLQRCHPAGSVLDVCGLPGAARVLSCSDDRSVCLQDWATGAVVQRWQAAHDGAVNRLAYLPGRACFASASRDRSIRVWSLTDNTARAASPVLTLLGHDLTVSAISATADGTRLASGSRDTTVRVWDLETGRGVYRGHRPQNLVTCLKWYPSLPATWLDAAGSPTVGTSGLGGDEQQCVLVQGGEDLRVRLWDTRAGVKEVAVLEGYVYFPLALDISPCGRYLLTSSKGFNGVGGEARLWDLRGGSAGNTSASRRLGPLLPDEFADPASRACLVRQYPGHLQDAAACAFLPVALPLRSGPCAAFLTGSKDGTLRLWDREGGGVLAEHVDAGYGHYTSLSLLPPLHALQNLMPYSAALAGLPASATVCFAAGTHDGRVQLFAVTAEGGEAALLPLAITPGADDETEGEAGNGTACGLPEPGVVGAAMAAASGAGAFRFSYELGAAAGGTSDVVQPKVASFSGSDGDRTRFVDVASAAGAAVPSVATGRCAFAQGTDSSAAAAPCPVGSRSREHPEPALHQGPQIALDMRAPERAAALSIAANPMQQQPHLRHAESCSMQEGASDLAQHGGEREADSGVAHLAGVRPGLSPALGSVAATAAHLRTADASENPASAQMPLKAVTADEANVVGATTAVGALAS